MSGIPPQIVGRFFPLVESSKRWRRFAGTKVVRHRPPNFRTAHGRDVWKSGRSAGSAPWRFDTCQTHNSSGFGHLRWRNIVDKVNQCWYGWWCQIFVWTIFGMTIPNDNDKHILQEVDSTQHPPDQVNRGLVNSVDQLIRRLPLLLVLVIWRFTNPGLVWLVLSKGWNTPQKNDHFRWRTIAMTISQWILDDFGVHWTNPLDAHVTNNRWINNDKHPPLDFT